MPNERLARQIVSALDGAPVRDGERWVVGLAVSGATWHTGRPYATDVAAFGRATREENREGCNAYVVARFGAQYAVYLAPSTILATMPVMTGEDTER